MFSARCLVMKTGNSKTPTAAYRSKHVAIVILIHVPLWYPLAQSLVVILPLVQKDAWNIASSKSPGSAPESVPPGTQERFRIPAFSYNQQMCRTVLITRTSIFSSSSCKNSPSAPIEEMLDELLADRMALEMYSNLCCKEISVLWRDKTNVQAVRKKTHSLRSCGEVRSCCVLLFTCACRLAGPGREPPCRSYDSFRSSATGGPCCVLCSDPALSCALDDPPNMEN